MGKRIRAVIGSQGGYALVAAMLIMLLITALGVLAMVTSSSEQTITTNLGESQMMFYHAEQAVDRILSHLAYLQGGLFSKVSGLGFDPTQSGNELSPSHVLNNKAVLYRVSSTIDASSIYRIDAWLDPKDFECSSDEDPCPKSVDRGLSRPVAVSVMVTNNRTGATKAFRFYARPRAAWDFAYYALNNNPTDRVNSNLAGENCSAASYTWYTCQSTMMSGDRVVGDVYISNSTMTPSDGIVAASPDTGRFFVRGAPQLLGEVRWRSPLPFDMGTYSGGVFTNSRNQTHGGSLTSAQPKAALGMKYYSRPVNMPTYEMIFGGAYRDIADIVLTNPNPSGSSTYVWKIIFRNDLDTHNDSGGGFPNRASSRVASAITRSINPGVSPTLGNPANEDRGVMMIYRVPYYDATTPLNEIQYQWAANYGNTMYWRDQKMTAAGGQIWSPSTSFPAGAVTGSVCYNTRLNNSASPTFGPYDPTDKASYNFIYVPSRGLSKMGSGTGCSGTYNGVIFVEGDVMVSGILDGQVTIVATGNIILDHEIEYENKPTSVLMSDYANLLEPDLLGLYSAGNVIVPNSIYVLRPSVSYGVSTAYDSDPRWSYLDDWSDAYCSNLACEESGPTFGPTGWKDTDSAGGPYPLKDDDGSEDIMAVILSYGYTGCTVGSGGSVTCSAPSSSAIQLFETGLYAKPRTYRAAFGTRPRYYDPPFDPASSVFNSNGGNSSGPLTITGAVIQNIPGRLAYDYYAGGNSWSSTCNNGVNCNRIGFSKVTYVWDPRLKYMLPPYPRQTSANRSVPYGGAAWDVLSWQEVRAVTSELQANVW